MINSDEFNEIIKLFRRIIETGQIPDALLPPNVEERNKIRTKRFGPIVFGRTTIVGPDGRARTQEWSNLPPDARRELEKQMEDSPFTFMIPPPPQDRRPSPIPDPLSPDRPFPGPQPEVQLKERDYLIDIIDTDDGYTAIFDTPATHTDDVKIHVDGHFLKLWVQGNLFRELELPTPVELTSSHFRNGILELQLRSKKPEEEPKQASGE